MDLLTLDTNCLIDLEEEREGYEFIIGLKNLSQQKIVNLGIPAIIASEKIIKYKRITSFNEFKEFLNNIDFGGFQLLLPPLYYGLTFWDYSMWSSQEIEELVSKIERILFNSTSDVDGSHDNGKKYEKWRNTTCDVLMFWSHVYYKRDVFITNDKNFHKQTKKQELLSLGTKNILTPRQAFDYYSQLLPIEVTNSQIQ